MKIIIVQEFESTLQGIEKSIATLDSSCLEHTTFTNSPLDVVFTLPKINCDEAIIIISDSTFAVWMDALELAKRIREINARAIFILYSIKPRINELIDGVIPKQVGCATTGDHKILAEIVVTSFKNGVLDWKKVITKLDT